MADRYLNVQTRPSPDMKWWQKLKYIGALLFVVWLIIFGIGLLVGSLACGCTNTGEIAKSPSPLPLDVFKTTITNKTPTETTRTPSTADLGNATTTPTIPTSPRTLEEEHQLQEQQVGTQPLCQLVYKSIKVMDLLKKNPSDALLDEEILSFNIRVPHCEGLCGGPSRCQPSRTADEDFVVMYWRENGGVQYAKRKVVHHKECKRC